MEQIEKIIWTQRGIESLESIAEFISIDSPFYASRFLKQIIQRIELLKDFPMMGRIVPEFNQMNFREIIYQNYRIIYKIERHTIYIVLIRHNYQLIPDDLNNE